MPSKRYGRVENIFAKFNMVQAEEQPRCAMFEVLENNEIRGERETQDVAARSSKKYSDVERVCVGNEIYKRGKSYEQGSIRGGQGVL
jgi:hypothetical protein